MSQKSSVMALMLALSAPVAWASPCEELRKVEYNANELEWLSLMQNVSRTENHIIDFPTVTMTHLIDASPEEAAASLINVDRHSYYVPQVKASEMGSTRKNGTFRGYYTLKTPVPIYEDEQIVQYHVSAREDGSYEIETKLLDSIFLSVSESCFRFSKISLSPTFQATLFQYRSEAAPKSPFMAVGAPLRVDSVKDDFNEFVQETYRMKYGKAEYLQAELELLRSLLKSE